MRKATVRDLRYRLPEIENLLREGQEIEIVKRSRVVARLLPAHAAAPPHPPDFLARLQKVYGAKRLLGIPGSHLPADERERF